MRPELIVTRDFDDSSARETTLCMNLHTGTHMDMPLHFIPGGDTVDMFDISRLVAACRVIDLIDVEFSIHAEDLLPFDIPKGEPILF